MIDIDYRLIYQPSGTVEKYIEFTRDNDEQAIEYANYFCNQFGSKLIRLEKIEITTILINNQRINTV